MANPVAPTTAESRSSFDDERVFELYWLPGNYTWIAAEVNRRYGLMLTYDDQGETRRVRFHHLVCGFNGTGPSATAKVLASAGFGERDALMAQISSHANEYLVFVKQPTL